MKIYILFYEKKDDPSREAWTVFYCPSEAWSTQALCDARAKELEDMGYETETQILDLDTPDEVEPAEYEDE